MKEMKTKSLGILGFAILMLIFSSAYASAWTAANERFYGEAYIGGVNATSGTHVEVYTGSGEFLADWNISGNNSYFLYIVVTNETNSTDNKAVTGENLTFKLNSVTAYTPAPGSETITAGSGESKYHTDIDINTTPSCTDGVKNQDELMTDCGGTSCTACYDLTMSPVTTSGSPHSETFSSVNTSDTFTLYVNNTGFHNISAIDLSSASCNFSVALGNSTLPQLDGTGQGNVTTGGGYYTVTVNKSISDLINGIYYCNITINSTNTSDVVYLKLTVNVVTTTTTFAPRRRYFSLSYTPDSPGAGECVTMTVTDRNSGSTVKGAEIDIFLDNSKVFYGNTDTDGKYESFCPTKAGDYEVKIDKSRYRQYIDTISVGAGGATTTVPEVVETTTTPGTGLEETPAPVATTTPAPVATTTPAPVVTTTPAPVATTPVAPPVEKNKGNTMTTWLILLLVLLIIIAIAYLMMKKKKEGETEKKE